MVRQTKAYLAGAASGTALIVIAIAAFVLLVSVQVFKDFPIAALGGDDRAAVAGAQPGEDSGTGGAGSSGAGAPGTGDAAGAGAANGGGGDTAADERAGAPGAGQPRSAGGGESGGGQTGDGDGQAGNGGSDGSTGSGQGATSTSPSGSGGGGSAPSSGGGGGETAASTPSAQIAETVNGTVDTVDETVLGGALQESGVTEVTEGVVDGLAGPESPVGKVVDETAESVGGLLGGKR